MKVLEDRSSHSSSSAKPLYIYQMTNKLLNQIYESALTLVSLTNSIVANDENAGYNFINFGFSQSCTAAG
jgi:hypothetical protein